MSIQNTALCFFIYAFLGWCGEVIFAAVKNKKFVNRGFLNGPVCPIYGFGVLIVTFALRGVSDNLFVLFLGSAVLTTLLELVSGFFFEKALGLRLWDYSKMPLNIGGYVCLLFSLAWGVFCVIIVRVVHPLVAKLVGILPTWLAIMLAAFFAAFFIADIIITFINAVKLPKRIRAIHDLETSLRSVSDKLGESLFDGVSELMEKNLQVREDLREKHPEIFELAEKYKEQVTLKRVEGRLVKAYPNMRSKKYKDALKRIKENLPKKRS